MKIKSYQKEFDYTYTLGVFETIEALKNKPEIVEKVYIKSKATKNKGVLIIEELCAKYHLDMMVDDTIIDKLSKKDNCFALAILNKYSMHLEDDNHVVLVNPGDMGNMGTIIRTMLGFEYCNLAIIRPGVDVFDPKVIRASMGALFTIRVEYFDSFDEYLVKYPKRKIYPLMLKGATNIHQIESTKEKHSLVFGNESSGLPDIYLTYGQSIFIPHSTKIDSLNLSMALGITVAHFSSITFKEQEILK